MPSDPLDKHKSIDRRVLSVRDIRGVVTRRCGGTRARREAEHTAPLALPGRSWRPGNLAEMRVLGPTGSPQVQVSGVIPHRIPTDKTAFPGTGRHRC